ncbi:MAG: Type 1 glutamine amidotransferase-like domain-containing protein [Defluviitaleaceae bacterium]|nr:Type 1 glutamine amidotransferase-like domain-containing protein [Defluviitaleaceae bacterium]
MQCWRNVLLTDSGFYFNNKLGKPLDPLINCLQAMLKKPFAEAKVLFIPTAAMENERKAKEITERLTSELLAMGFIVNNITIHDIDGSLTVNDAMQFDIIYITGGKTPYLAERVRASGFDEIIEGMIYANKVYIGMSAGSALLASHFNANDAGNQKFVGLGFLNAYISVHCGDTPIREDLPLPHIALKENQAIELFWNGYKLIDGNLQYIN